MNRTERLAEWLETLYSRYDDPSWIGTDPVEFPHRTAGNREFVAFTSAVFAYGRVSSIKSFLESFFSRVGEDPAALKRVPRTMVYRFQARPDIDAYARAMADVYAEYGSIEKLFVNLNPTDVQDALVRFRGVMIEKGRAYGGGRGYEHLFPDPEKSAAKRLHMFLRWMIRRDAVDFGEWSQYNKARLRYPLDTHVSRFAKAVGMLQSDAVNAVSAIRVTEAFGRIAPDDPVKYDFALARLGIAHQCAYGQSMKCELCTLNNGCFLIDKYEKLNIVDLNR